MGRSERLVVLALAAMAAPMALACNAILGIDEFKRTECGAEPCPFDGGEDQFVPDTSVPDSRIDTGVDAPPGVGPVSWAAWQMPNHQKDAGIIADDPNPLAYTINGPDEVTDAVTGLVWRRKVIGFDTNPPLGDEKLEKDALAECQKLNSADVKWRVPKRIELVTLLSHSLTNPASIYIDTTAFPGVPSKVVWTSSEVRTVTDGVAAVVPNKFWAVDFKTGAVVQTDAIEGARVLCVKDKQ